jgi:hypothetical protein
MHYDRKQSTWIILSTGRHIYGNGLDLLSPRPDGSLSHGYDGTFYEAEADGGALTAAERREIAEYMIARWSEWAQKVRQDGE